jgi:dCTP deaminase
LKELMGRESGSFHVVPTPNFSADHEGQASIDLRLGRWFRTLRQSRTPELDIVGNGGIESSETRLTKEYFVRFGDKFVLHPGKFVLGITLEWIGLPANLSAYVTGKSSLGRRGLIIETAAGVHPGFKGCLTLELTNVGEVPIALRPPMRICQIFLHDVMKPGEEARGQFRGRRKPVLGRLEPDDVVRKLAAGVAP